MNEQTVNEFVAANEVTVSGKMISKRYNPKTQELVVTVSADCGNKSRKKNEKGQIVRDIVTVRFLNVPAMEYNKMFKIGDFVSILAVAQNIKDERGRSSHTEIWGFEMRPKKDKERDTNRVHIRGKIVTSKVLTKDYIILNVLTATTKQFDNPKDGSKVESFEEQYRSVTPIGIRCKGDAYEVIKVYTPGTWVDCKGFVNGRVVEKDDKTRREMRIISLKTEVVGTTQPIRVVLR